MRQFLAVSACAASLCCCHSQRPPASGDAAKGQATFRASCAICHNADSEEKKMGPGLKGLFKRDKMADGKKVSEANIRSRIDDGGQGMPPYKDVLEDQQKEDLIAYLKTL